MQTIVLYLRYIVLILLFSTAYNTSLIYCFVIWCLHTNKRRLCSFMLSGHPSSSYNQNYTYNKLVYFVNGYGPRPAAFSRGATRKPPPGPRGRGSPRAKTPWQQFALRRHETSLFRGAGAAVGGARAQEDCCFVHVPQLHGSPRAHHHASPHPRSPRAPAERRSF